MTDKIEYTADENYEEYIKNFTRTDESILRKIPNMRGVKDFDFVDESSRSNRLTGYSDKYCVRAHVMLLRDLVKEILINPNSSYQFCYTTEEIMTGSFPEYFSVLMKQPDSLHAVESEVFASRLLNYFGVPVVYNRRIDKGYPHYESSKYVMSVDMIRRNEKLVLLNDFVPLTGHYDVSRYDRNGLKETLDMNCHYLKAYLDSEGINYTEDDIENYKLFLFNSILIRIMLLGDMDLRNGNAGILIDIKNKTFRPLPNFDMEKSFSTLANSNRFSYLKEFYDLYPKEYDEFIRKMIGLFEPTKRGLPLYEVIARKSMREESVANSIMYKLYTSASEILDETLRFKKVLGEDDNNEKGKEILA